MPFYRYECGKCQGEFRVLQRSGDKKTARCPHCGSDRTQRLLPRIGVIYKGSGYYSTDYRSKSKKTASSSSSSSNETSTKSKAEE